MLGALAFNLVVNSALSFGVAWLIVAAVLRLSRVAPSRTQLVLLLAPWLKLTWDAAHGIPEGSFFWQRLAGVRQDLGSFQLGLGATRFGPLVQFRLGALHDSKQYPQSAAELLSSGLSRWWGPLPEVLAALVISVSVLLVARRLLLWRRAGASFARPATPVWRSVALGQRRVEVYVSASHTGAPFAAGVLRPYVVFSELHFARLNEAEREACLGHELAHIAHGDTWLSPLLILLTDLGWFLPGVRALLGRVLSLLELRADGAAVRAGAAPEALASALVTTGELLHAPRAVAVGLQRRGLLARRVRRLLEPAAEPEARSGAGPRVLRLVGTLVVVGGLLQSVFFGNYGLG